MLVQFIFNNFKCFKDDNILNLTTSKSKKTFNYTHETNFNYSVLRTVAVYGANASGKTKLFEAIKFLRCVLCPPKRNGVIPIFDYWQTQYAPFKLNTQTADGDSSFEVTFLLNNIQYRYGITLNSKEILSEWLYKKNYRDTLILHRNRQKDFKITPQYINEKTFNVVRSAKMISATSPLLSILSTFNDELSQSIVKWFESITVISANDMNTVDALTKNEKKGCIIAFLNAFDINIDDISLHETSIDNIPEKIKNIIGIENLQNGKLYDGINTTHRLYNNYYERVGNCTFSLENDESFGTNRLFNLSWPIIKSLKEGSVLFIDEIDSGIHTNIIKVIIALYYMSSSKAQLIFNTQNTSLLNTKSDDDSKLFIKDQIYVVNKNRYGESRITPITEFDNDLRSNLEKIYLSGEISGVPYVDVQKLLNIIEQ